MNYQATAHRCFGDLHCYGSNHDTTQWGWIIAAAVVLIAVVLIVRRVHH